MMIVFILNPLILVPKAHAALYILYLWTTVLPLYEGSNFLKKL